MAHSAAFWIKHLNMDPHPEGGHFAVVHRSEEAFPMDYFRGVKQIKRNHFSHIYYLLETGQKSAVHRLKFNELWHFYAGDPMQLFYLSEDEKLGKLILSNEGEVSMPAGSVSANAWQWATPVEGENGFCLVGCSMTPAFHEEDWEMGEKKYLLEKYPHLQDFWERFCIR